jgi:hypothetical protein
VSQLHELAGHVAEARGRQGVAAEGRGMARSRVKPSGHHHQLWVKLLPDTPKR